MRNAIFVLILFLFSAPAWAETRIALVIGNSRYAHETTLRNPENDARAVAQALEDVGYDVTVAYDLSYAQMMEALRDFGRQARESEVALAYYAGHGIEAGGQNYLIPTDADLITVYDLPLSAVNLSALIGTAGQATRLSMVMLDACRNNRFRSNMIGSGRGDEIGRGLGPTTSRRGNLVVYSAAAGEIASDGVEGAEHSPFAAAFLQTLEEQPDRDIGLFFRRVADRVWHATEGKQSPALYGALSGDEIPMRRPLTPAEIAQRDYACVTRGGLAGVWFHERCLQLDTTQIGPSHFGFGWEISNGFNISPLAALTQLQELNLSETQVIDLSPLSELHNLQKLYLPETLPTNLHPLRSLTKLHFLYTPDMQGYGDWAENTPEARIEVAQAIHSWPQPIDESSTTRNIIRQPYSTTRLSNTADRAQQEYACVTKTDDAGISFAHRCWPLTTTQIGGRNSQIPHVIGANIDDLAPLAGLTELQELRMNRVTINGLSPLAELKNLRILSLTHMSVSSLRPLAELFELRKLDIFALDVIPGSQSYSVLAGLEKLHFLQMPNGFGGGGGSDTPANRAAVAEFIRTRWPASSP